MQYEKACDICCLFVFTVPVVAIVCCGRNPENDAATHLMVAYRNGTVVMLPVPNAAATPADAQPWSLPAAPRTQDITLTDICLSPHQTLLAGFSRGTDTKDVSIWSSNYAFQGYIGPFHWIYPCASIDPVLPLGIQIYHSLYPPSRA